MVKLENDVKSLKVLAYRSDFVRSDSASDNVAVVSSSEDSLATSMTPVFDESGFSVASMAVMVPQRDGDLVSQVAHSHLTGQEPSNREDCIMPRCNLALVADEGGGIEHQCTDNKSGDTPAIHDLDSQRMSNQREPGKLVLLCDLVSDSSKHLNGRLGITGRFVSQKQRQMLYIHGRAILVQPKNIKDPITDQTGIRDLDCPSHMPFMLPWLLLKTEVNVDLLLGRLEAESRSDNLDCFMEMLQIEVCLLVPMGPKREDKLARAHNLMHQTSLQPAATVAAGRIYEDIDVGQARVAFEKAVLRNSAEASVHLFEMECDYAWPTAELLLMLQSSHHLRTSAARGSGEAMHKLAFILALTCREDDRVEAMRWYRTAGEKGNGISLYNVALDLNEKGASTDESIRLLEKSLLLGYSPAKTLVAVEWHTNEDSRLNGSDRKRDEQVELWLQEAVCDTVFPSYLAAIFLSWLYSNGAKQNLTWSATVLEYAETLQPGCSLAHRQAAPVALAILRGGVVDDIAPLPLEQLPFLQPAKKRLNDSRMVSLQNALCRCDTYKVQDLEMMGLSSIFKDGAVRAPSGEHVAALPSASLVYQSTLEFVDPGSDYILYRNGRGLALQFRFTSARVRCRLLKLRAARGCKRSVYELCEILLAEGSMNDRLSRERVREQLQSEYALDPTSYEHCDTYEQSDDDVANAIRAVIEVYEAEKAAGDHGFGAHCDLLQEAEQKETNRFRHALNIIQTEQPLLTDVELCRELIKRSPEFATASQEKVNRHRYTLYDKADELRMLNRVRDMVWKLNGPDEMKAELVAYIGSADFEDAFKLARSRIEREAFLQTREEARRHQQPEAYLATAISYWFGFGTRINYAKAVLWYKDAKRLDVHGRCSTCRQALEMMLQLIRVECPTISRKNLDEAAAAFFDSVEAFVGDSPKMIREWLTLLGTFGFKLETDCDSEILLADCASASELFRMIGLPKPICDLPGLLHSGDRLPEQLRPKSRGCSFCPRKSTAPLFCQVCSAPFCNEECQRGNSHHLAMCKSMFATYSRPISKEAACMLKHLRQACSHS